MGNINFFEVILDDFGEQFKRNLQILKKKLNFSTKIKRIF